MKVLFSKKNTKGDFNAHLIYDILYNGELLFYCADFEEIVGSTMAANATEHVIAFILTRLFF